MLNLFKQIKARLLKKWAVELIKENVTLKDNNKNLNKELLSLRQLNNNKRTVVISKTMSEVLFKLLPDVNENLKRFSDLNYLKSVRATYYDNDGERQAIFLCALIPLMENGEAKNEITGLRFKSTEMGLEFEINFLLRNNLNTTIAGTNLEIQTYVWDLASSGIQVISDNALNTIKQFVLSTGRVMNELNQM